MLRHVAGFCRAITYEELDLLFTPCTPLLKGGYLTAKTTVLPIGHFHRKRELEGLIGEGAETVEPILESFGGYSTDNLSNFYYPYIIVLLMVFRDEVSHFFSLVHLIYPASWVTVFCVSCPFL